MQSDESNIIKEFEMDEKTELSKAQKQPCLRDHNGEPVTYIWTSPSFFDSDGCTGKKESQEIGVSCFPVYHEKPYVISNMQFNGEGAFRPQLVEQKWGMSLTFFIQTSKSIAVLGHCKILYHCLEATDAVTPSVLKEIIRPIEFFPFINRWPHQKIEFDFVFKRSGNSYTLSCVRMIIPDEKWKAITNDAINTIKIRDGRDISFNTFDYNLQN
jgi:hypothetical protein